MAKQNPFIWQELITPNQKTSGDFYSKLFGWTTKQVDADDYGNYTIFKKDGVSIAGMMDANLDTVGKSSTSNDKNEDSYWHPYIAVDDIEESVTQTVALGGKIMVPPQHVPDEGWIAVIADPNGAVVHLKQPLIKQMEL
ncbi:VOC family protein [Cocleimonas sp. KMM 6892]|uniref:VOC family protein n=1 Tax=unclassified Cocleimonas TaxID=2639732 RepID=UPI002DBB45CE|nr:MULTISPECIES: VOC family protein [unclassified Cocleimonas]MEB8431126.1 VOC family protein [Cocleimonas sp. KMM 6892]MEC4714102.1 VOC family protein [Cocleimonas sp. KMM 6895]MEC4743433.1 VOC family protein [Cocleimonas sp. KMM 6896]